MTIPIGELAGILYMMVINIKVLAFTIDVWFFTRTDFWLCSLAGTWTVGNGTQLGGFDGDVGLLTLNPNKHHAIVAPFASPFNVTDSLLSFVRQNRDVLISLHITRDA